MNVSFGNMFELYDVLEKWQSCLILKRSVDMMKSKCTATEYGLSGKVWKLGLDWIGSEGYFTVGVYCRAGKWGRGCVVRSLDAYEGVKRKLYGEMSTYPLIGCLYTNIAKLF